MLKVRLYRFLPATRSSAGCSPHSRCRDSFCLCDSPATIHCIVLGPLPVAPISRDKRNSREPETDPRLARLERVPQLESVFELGHGGVWMSFVVCESWWYVQVSTVNVEWSSVKSAMRGRKGREGGGKGEGRGSASDRRKNRAEPERQLRRVFPPANKVNSGVPDTSICPQLTAGCSACRVQRATGTTTRLIYQFSIRLPFRRPGR